MFGGFFKRRKMRVIAFGKLEFHGSRCYVVFYQNNNDKRKYKMKGNDSGMFKHSSKYVDCNIWADTGLLPTWAKDPVAEKLSR